MPMHKSENGVPGPSQNIQQALATPNNHLDRSVPQVIKPIKYGTQTSLDTTRNTIMKMSAVCQSRILIHNHLNGKEARNQTHFQKRFHLEGSALMSRFSSSCLAL